MEFKRVHTSSKKYIILLVAAIVLLLFTATIAYRQIMRMQKSAEMITHTLEVYNAIGNLSYHYSQADSEEFREMLLKKGNSSVAFEKYKLEGKAIMDSLNILTIDNPLQQLRLKPLKGLLKKLYSELLVLDAIVPEKDQDSFELSESHKSKINATLNNILILRNKMLLEEKGLLQERKANYASHKFLAPLTSLLLGFFALFIFVLSFIKIYQNKRRIRESEAFLRNILATTDNIINYYEPIFDSDNKIIDFNIVYANDCNRDYLGLEPNDIMGKSVSKTFPFLLANGKLEELLKCYNEKTKVIFDRQVTVEDKKMWFHSFATPLGEGVLQTTRNSTIEEEAKRVQLAFKKRLENQNLELLDNRAFLGNIFKSISHVVMHFKSIRGEDGKIIDFEILFVNDRVNPVTGDFPKEIKNKKTSKVYPEIFESGVFEYLVDVIENDKTLEYEIPYYENGLERWFHSTAIKLNNGVTITTREITEEKKKAHQLLKLNEDLIIQNSILTDAERIAEIGSFLWFMDTNTSEVSDNLYRMLGYEPNGFEPSLIKFKDFIHPEDIDLFEKNSNESIKTLKTNEYIYRIITKQGKVKHFKTNGKFINENNKTFMIVVAQDVTHTIEAEKELLKSNLELKYTNAELESFNRVASHDLQEPLRKIQLFISRIEDSEGKQLSSKSSEYFEKVTNAVKRMQSLIQNLLAYSRIDSSKKDFEKVDLNNVLDKVREDLTTRIKDAEAEILADKLPKIKGVIFQMEQLFTNLISNALKFTDTNKTPKIHIKYEQVHASKMPEDILKSTKYYHKISFIDNGIGFDSEHAEKIFEVFQRLHQKTEYSGTGIGLAICKKIAENHNGYILADGTAGVGAEFIIYLPA
ncbi:PAS domain S-box-containing protein [Flaviramulus basaltis]|uniref:histidine kinase n=1 Tax=Flaviramulus basaltis TaxID=369401 RepID=A0A1K2IJE8_9FLAO|nr:ATP-binding protein [Flaviramulus basaltis]SFZ92352.1 PAS domain S-box-containing protein [Flaviramulus basaltis]